MGLAVLPSIAYHTSAILFNGLRDILRVDSLERLIPPDLVFLSH